MSLIYAIYQIDPMDLKHSIDQDQVVLFDVREPAEYRAEWIAQAKNLPLSKISKIMVDQMHLSENRDKKLVVYCKSGRRSQMVCEQLHRANAPFDIWNLAGGIDAWKTLGLPVKKSGKKCFPLDRQVQLSIGLILLIGLGMTYADNQYGFILLLVISLGLINAGLTGWCGLAKLIAKMPWNQ